MKWKDKLKFSFRFFRRDKMLILFSIAIVSILFSVINFCGYTVSSLIRSYSNDIEGYLRETEAVEIGIGPGESMEPKIERDTFLFVQEKLSGYQIETELRIITTVSKIDCEAEEVGYFTIKPIHFSIASELTSGDDWKETEKGQPNIWLGEELYQVLCPTQLKEVKIFFNDEPYVFTVKGITNGNRVIYFDTDYLLEQNFAYIQTAQFLLHDVKDLKALKKLDRTVKQIKKVYEKNAIDSEALIILMKDRWHVGKVSALCVAVSLLMAGLALYMLHNFISVHIYDNMKFYAILRCLGARNHCITPMILSEIAVIILSGFVISNIVNIFTKQLIKDILLAFVYEDFIAIENLHVVKWWWGGLLLPVVIFAINYLFAKVKNHVLFKNETLLERFREEL